MKTVSNKSQKPLSIPLPRGKVLHLGPGKTGQIASTAVDHPPLKRLVEAGELEVLGEGAGPGSGPAGGATRRGAAHGFGWGGGRHRSGDR